MSHKKVLSVLLVLALFAGLMTTAFAAETAVTVDDASAYVGDIDNTNIDPALYLDYSAGIEAGVYQWILSDDGSYYVLAAVNDEGDAAMTEEAAINVGSGTSAADGAATLDTGDENTSASGEASGASGEASGGSVYQGVYTSANITNVDYQTMLIYVPAAYLAVDADGNVTGIDYEAEVNGYTAVTAPVVYQNECGGWRSSKPGSCDTDYIDAGFVYVYAGARSRDAKDADGIPSGKAPTQVVDLKAGVIELRANADVIPGDFDKIVSVGGSGGGQMSSIFGASGNMPEYYEYMYESGVLGVMKNDDGTYSSVYDDSIYGCQCYCPIADIENADLAYAWWWVGLNGLGGEKYGGSTLSDFKLRLQELEADAFISYINSLGLTDADGNALTLTGLRTGTYYDAVLDNISAALNSAVVAGTADPDADYDDYSDWLVKNDDGTWQVTDLDAFMVATGLVNSRGKDVPGFDTLGKNAENDAFGTTEDSAVHFSASVAAVLQANYDELSTLDGFNAEQVDNYIEEALTGDKAASTAAQVNLMNATEILLGSDGLSAVDPAEYWRVRSGTADQHTSFTIGFNICLAAQMFGSDADYHLVWSMGHGSNEGTTTGTFIDWISEICAE